MPRRKQPHERKSFRPEQEPTWYDLDERDPETKQPDSYLDRLITLAYVTIDAGEEDPVAALDTQSIDPEYPHLSHTSIIELKSERKRKEEEERRAENAATWAEQQRQREISRRVRKRK